MRIAIQTPTLQTQAAAAIYAGNLLRALRDQTGPEDSIVSIDDDTAWWRRGRARLRAVDICHAIGQLPARQNQVAVIPLVHDLAPLRYPAHHSLCTVRHFANFLATLDRFGAIQTLTEFTRAELVHHTGLDARRIAVLRPGVDELFHAAGRPDDALELQAIGLLPQQFFLTVGGLDPLGNFATLAAGYARLPPRIRTLLPLVVAGDRGRNAPSLTPAVQAEIESGNIRLLGHVPRFLLRVLYRAALLAAFPAVYGGFGLAVAEAAICGTPLAVSRGTAMAELAGPHATQVDALDAAGWEMALVDQVGRGRHATPIGRPASQDNFTWSENARATRALYARVLN